MLGIVGFIAIALATWLYRVVVKTDNRLIYTAAEVGEFVFLLAALLCVVLLYL
jgi:hypothetical protein